MIEFVRQLVMDNWSIWFPGLPRPTRLRLLKSTHVSASWGRILFFVFPDKAFYPVALAKVPRDDSGRALLRQEHDTLNKVHSLVSAELKATIPEPLTLVEWGRELIGLERALEGHPQENTPHQSVRSPLAAEQRELAQNWLLAFHTQTNTALVTLSSESVFSTTLSSLEALRAYYQLTSHEEKLIARLKEQMSQLADQCLPLVCQHGDFWTGNILWKDGKISGIVDWEHSRLEAPPFRDLFLFARDAGLVKRDGSLQLDEFVHTYFAQMNLDDRFVELFWPVVLATLATRECSLIGEQPTTSDWHFRKLFRRYALSVSMEREL